jgi:predicted transcriptional regulator
MGHTLISMKQLLIEIDEEIAAQLERVAPARSRRRSEFIRNAIRQALWDLEERATAAAYARLPDSEEADLEAAVWEAGAGPHAVRA